MKVTKEVVAMLEDIVAYAYKRQMEFMGEEPAQLYFPARLEDLLFLSCALGNAIQFVDRDSQIGSNYTWEDACFIQVSSEFSKAYDEITNKDWKVEVE